MRAALIAMLLITVTCSLPAQQAPDTVTIQWDKTQLISKTALTLQVVVNPPLRRGSDLHDSIFAALQTLECDYVR
ncbi:MAG TPA: hypothetical protein VG605_22190, partial [Puia sp.]|nr:hypothetical protein [Puia sp.]